MYACSCGTILMFAMIIHKRKIAIARYQIPDVIDTIIPPIAKMPVSKEPTD